MLRFKIVKSQEVEFKLFLKMTAVRHWEVRSTTIRRKLNLREQAPWTKKQCSTVFKSECSIMRQNI